MCVGEGGNGIHILGIRGRKHGSNWHMTAIIKYTFRAILSDVA